LGGVEWIELAEVRDRWRAVVGAVMNLGVLAPRKAASISYPLPREKLPRTPTKLRVQFH
jgi:hypothetical protein